MMKPQSNINFDANSSRVSHEDSVVEELTNNKIFSLMDEYYKQENILYQHLHKNHNNL